jgi:hypothetical protein
MPYYDYRDLVTDPEAYFDRVIQESILDANKSTEVWYDDSYKAWFYIDMETGKILVQPRKTLKYLEFELGVERSSE